MAISEDLAQELLSRWLTWQASRPAHQRLFFSFFEEVVRKEATLQEVTLLDVLTVLNTTAGIGPATER